MDLFLLSTQLLLTLGHVLNVQAGELGEVAEDGEDDAAGDDGGEEVQRAHDARVDVDLVVKLVVAEICWRKNCVKANFAGKFF